MTAADAAAVAAIYTQGIEGRGATFETQPRAASDVAGWPDEGPAVVVEHDGAVVGWALGSGGVGLLVGAVVGIPLAVLVVYKVYS